MSLSRWYFHVGEASLTWDTPLTNNVTYAVRQELPPVTIDRLGVEISVSQTSSAVRLGIYLDNEGLPDTVVYDAGTVATTSTGIREIVFPALSLDGGIYWFSATPQNSGSMPTYVAPVDVSWSKIPQTTSMTVGHQHSGTLIDQNAYTGALGTFGTPGTSTRICPRIFYRYASNDLEGFITAASNATGSLSVARPLAATASAAASATGSLKRAVPLAATTSASASASASLSTTGGPTHFVTSGTGTNAASFLTASKTPSTNALQLILVENARASGAGPTSTPSLTGCGLIWVAIRTVTDSSGLHITTLYRALGTPTPGAVTIATPGQTQAYCFWSWSQIPGTDTTGTNGSGAIVQDFGGTADATPALNINLSAFASSNNLGFGGFASPNYRTFAPATGETQLGNFGLSGTGTILTEYILNPAGPSLTMTSTAPATISAIAVEVKMT